MPSRSNPTRMGSNTRRKWCSRCIFQRQPFISVWIALVLSFPTKSNVIVLAFPFSFLTRTRRSNGRDFDSIQPTFSSTSIAGDLVHGQRQAPGIRWYLNQPQLSSRRMDEEGPSDDIFLPKTAVAGAAGYQQLAGNPWQQSPQPTPENVPPIPAMPSDLFQQLALSQLELLASSVPSGGGNKRKIKSMALYLPQENTNTGQLEFLPAVIYPDPSRERVFVASGAGSGVAPTLPKMLTKLPGFAHATSLLPGYPMVSSSAYSTGETAGIGVVEEVLCDVRSGAAALSVPLFHGSQTVGVLLVSPDSPGNQGTNGWTEEDRQQIARAAKTLSMALSMDMERIILERQNRQVRRALSNSLHQVKNPLQALRTFGKLLQRRVASTDDDSGFVAEVGTMSQLLELTQNVMEQSDRVVNLLAPMDSIVESLDSGNKSPPWLYLSPADNPKSHSLVPWDEANPPSLPWETETLELARRYSKVPKPSLLVPSKVTSNDRPENGKRSPRSTTSGQFSAVNYTRNSKRMDFGMQEKRATSPKESTVGAKSKLAKDNAMPSTLTSKPSSSSSSSIVGPDDEMEMVFLLDVLDPVFRAFQAIAEDRGISFEILGLDHADELPGVTIRRKALQEAVSNLLENALKYVVAAPTAAQETASANTPPQPPPKVQIRLLANDDYDDELAAGVTIFVEDNGPGISAEEVEAIFVRGFRGNNTSSLVQGTGIGLDIARSLVASMGGKLDCLIAPARQGIAGSKFLNGAVFCLNLFRRPTTSSDN